MAKKKKELSLEEKLEQAVVPVDEQPYEVPGNWCWVKLDQLVSIVTGKKDANYGSENGEYYFFTCASEPIKCEGYTFEGESLLLPGNGANVGQVYYFNGKFEAYQRTYVLQALTDDCNLRYLYYYILGFWDEYNKDKQYGSATNYIKMGNFTSFNVALPPFEEQKRIVKAIESMFEKLDEAKEIAEEIVASAKLRKMSILYETFSGKLTANWRQKNGVSDESWQEKTLNEVCKSIYDGDHMPPPKSESGIPFLVISNVNKGILSFENTRFVPEEYYENITDTRKPEKGDLLYTLVGSYGIPVMVDDDRAFCFQRHMGLLKPNRIDAKFLWYQMQSQEFYDKATGIANGTAQLTVPIKGLRKLKIFCPTKEEQMEIVSLLDKIWEKESITEQIVSGVIEDIDALKKSILAKAFRGELGTNIESEESSIELLKQILEVS